MTITLGRISLLYSKSTTKVTKQLPHILYHTCFFFFFMNGLRIWGHCNMVIGTKELGQLLFQGEKIKIEKN